MNEIEKLADLIFISSKITLIMMIPLSFLLYFVCKRLSKFITYKIYLIMLVITIIIWIIGYQFYNIINNLLPNFPVKYPYVYCIMWIIIVILEVVFTYCDIIILFFKISALLHNYIKKRD
jgi:cation transport ATPase